MNPNAPSPYMTIRELMEYLRLPSQSAVYRHIRNGTLPYCRVGRHYRFDKREIDAKVRGYDSALEMTRAKRSA